MQIIFYYSFGLNWSVHFIVVTVKRKLKNKCHIFFAVLLGNVCILTLGELDICVNNFG